MASIDSCECNVMMPEAAGKGNEIPLRSGAHHDVFLGNRADVFPFTKSSRRARGNRFRNLCYRLRLHGIAGGSSAKRRWLADAQPTPPWQTRRHAVRTTQSTGVTMRIE